MEIKPQVNNLEKQQKEKKIPNFSNEENNKDEPSLEMNLLIFLIKHKKN